MHSAFIGNSDAAAFPRDCLPAQSVALMRELAPVRMLCAQNRHTDT
jgi:hypothetical protein